MGLSRGPDAAPGSRGCPTPDRGQKWLVKVDLVGFDLDDKVEGVFSDGAYPTLQGNRVPDLPLMGGSYTDGSSMAVWIVTEDHSSPLNSWIRLTFTRHSKPER
jgi:hypothetical protein